MSCTVSHRPKVEDYPARGSYPGGCSWSPPGVEVQDGRLAGEQISIFLGRTTLLTFPGRPGDAFSSIRRRLQTSGSQLRENDVSFLLYALLDAIVDSYFPILERSRDRLEEIEDELLTQPDPATWRRVHPVQRDLLLLRRAAWPMRELITQFQRENTSACRKPPGPISATSTTTACRSST